MKGLRAMHTPASCSITIILIIFPRSTGTFGMPEENEFLANFTCRYLSFMDTDVAELVYYPTIDSAVQAVEDGEAWGVISMEKNFTRDLYQRIFESLVCYFTS